ncbi:MAG: hypothetical protein B7Y39_12020 [Bdellovibrio sp. 28-41-41]|nr:MAG: hypothetical protein B7Y39_12020 [Bdellovibrio sp. 28-41-41]
MDKFKFSLLALLVSLVSIGGTTAKEKEAEKILDLLTKHISSDQKKADAKYNSAAHCNIDEEQFLPIESDIIKPLKAMILQKVNVADIQSIFGAKFTSNGFPFQRGEMNRNFPSEFMAEYSLVPFEKPVSLVDFKAKMENETKVIKQVDYASLDVVQVFANKSMRSKNLKNLVKAELLARFDFRFINDKKEKINSRGNLKINVSKEESKWKISSIALVEGSTLVSTGTDMFKEMTSNLSPNIPVFLRREAIRRGGYATAMGDYNNDGNVDMFIATSGKTQLFRGLGNGQFELDKDSGLLPHTLVKSAAFVDLFNTGKQDLVLVRFDPENENRNETKRSDVVIYKNDGKKFTQLDNSILFKNNHYYAMPMAIGDFNKDGFLDLFIGFPGAKDFTFLKEHETLNKQQLLSHGFFMNQGNEKHAFYEKNVEELWKAGMIENTIRPKAEWFTDPQYYYPHSAVAVDYNLDKNMDIVVIDDRTRLSPVYQGVDGGGFVKSNDSINFRVHDYGMGVAFGDLFGNNKMDFIMTAVNFVPNERMYNSCGLNWDIEYSTPGSQGIRVYKNEGKGFAEVSKAYGLDFAGYGMSGVELIDYNNDGNLDIFIANGLWSGTKDDSDLDLSSKFARAANMTLFELDLLPDNKLSPRFNNPVGNVNISNAMEDYGWMFFHLSSQSSIMNILVNGKTKDGKNYSLAGFQKKRVFRNNGDGSFTEVGYGLGLDNISDGYMMAFADLNNDGKLDVVQRNSDPGIRGDQYPPVQVFLNNMNIKNNSLVLKLVGAAGSNMDAVGSVVTAEVGKKKILRQLTAMNGTIQSDKVIHIGLGDLDSAKNIEITWPNGQKQKIDNLKKGFHKVTQQVVLSKN